MNSRVLLKRAEGLRKRLERKISEADQHSMYCVTGSPLNLQIEALKTDLSELTQAADKLAASFGRSSSEDDQATLAGLVNRLTQAV